MEKETAITDINQESILIKLLEKASKKFAKENHISSLAYLKQAEELLEILTTHGKPLPTKLTLLTLHNIACCYQHLGDMDKCVAYLDACHLNASSMRSSSVLKHLKFRAQLLLQHCVSLSNQKKHGEALEKANEAVAVTEEIFKCTVKAHKALASKIKYKRFKDKLQLKISQKVLEASAESIDAMVNIKPSVQIRSVLGVTTFSSWVYDFNISDVMVMKSLNLAEFNERSPPYIELTKDFILYKVALHAIALFCIATETKHLKGIKKISNSQRKNAEVSHQKAIKLMNAFFPQESPLLSHVVSSYERRLLCELQEIPEEEEDRVKKLPSIRPHKRSTKVVKPQILLKNRPKSSLGNRKFSEARHRVKSMDLSKRAKSPHDRSVENDIILS